MQENRERVPATVEIRLEPENREFTLARPKTVRQLLQRLDIRPGTALVIRDGGLLTPDRQIVPGDTLTVRVVTSSG